MEKRKENTNVRAHKRGRIATAVIALLLIFALLPPVSANAASYTGTYRKVWKKYYMLQNGKKVWYKHTTQNGIYPTYSVIINKLKKKKAVIQVEYIGLNGSPLYQTKVITAKRKGKKLTFKWEDTWGNKGKGTIKLYKKYLKIKMVETETSSWNRASLATDGYRKLKKKNNKKKVYSW